MHRRLYILFSILSLALVGCRTALQTVAPEEKYEEVDFSPQVSSFIIPLDFSIPEMQTLANKYTEGILYEDNNMDDDNFMVKVEKHSPITLSLYGNEIQYRVPLKVWLKGGASLQSFGLSLSNEEEAEGSLALVFRTKIDFDPFWNIQTTTRFISYEWLVQPKFSIPLLTIPFKIVADRMIKNQQASISAMIDEQVKKNVDTRKYIETAWDYMHQPINLSTNPPTWLKLQPKELFVSPFTSDAQHLYVTVGLKAITETVIGKQPVLTSSNLPTYKVEKNQSNAYNIQLAVNISYEDVTEMSRKYLKGQVYTFNNGKKKIVIDDVTFYGNAEKMVAEVLLSGSLNGKVYLKGLPVYDSTSRKVVFSQLDFDLDTKNKLTKSANWLAHDILVKKMAPYFSYYIGDQLDSAAVQARANLKRKQLHPNFTVDGTLEKLQPSDIVLTKDGIIALVNAKGVIRLFVTGLDRY
ncbi:MAG: DUF4403 family protein [Cytophagaceae bacterium]|nr:DUF4403 family protein [Cytophagaceae bacterium]